MAILGAALEYILRSTGLQRLRKGASEVTATKPATSSKRKCRAQVRNMGVCEKCLGLRSHPHSGRAGISSDFATPFVIIAKSYVNRTIFHKFHKLGLRGDKRCDLEGSVIRGRLPTLGCHHGCIALREVADSAATRVGGLESLEVGVYS